MYNPLLLVGIYLAQKEQNIPAAHPKRPCLTAL